MEFILSAVVTLILIMDPFGNIPLFITSLKKVSPERRRFVLLRELAIATAIMVTFLFAGGKALDLLGIKQYSMGISGGIILFIMSLKLVFNSLEDESTKNNPKEEEPFIVPLAIPLIAGPATLSMLLIFSATPGGNIWQILIALLIASIINSAILLLSFPISNMLGKRGLIAVERLTGMLLVLMSVNMVMNGIAEFLKSYNL
ncbi:MarC family protein [Candidatus Proelusimicrobium excrementi]|uniref:MarC family protein n=1 Tax=Candidatus Proelusimicrobium excrementi TaxID=3416222 RepID=UPI003C7F15BA|nr:NAAT family transporter [Elusimicrobiaceae bacterium]